MSTPMQSPNLNVRGWAYTREDDGFGKLPAVPTWFRPRGHRDLEPTFGQENLVDQRQRDEFLIKHPSWPGVKQFAAAMALMTHENTVTELDQIFKACLGKTSSAAALTIKPAGVHTASEIEMNDGNLPPPIISILGSDGKRYDRPVLSFGVVGANKIKLAIALPGGVLPTAVQNPVARNGKCYQEDPDADVDTFLLEVDRRGQTGETKGRGFGNVPNMLELAFELGQHLGLRLSFQGGEWTTGAAPNVQKHARFTNQFLSYHASCFWQPIDAVVAPVSFRLRSLGMNLAPEWNPLLGSTGTDGNDADPLTNLFGWERGPLLDGGINLGLALPYVAGYADRSALTSRGLYLRFKSKAGGAAAPSKLMAVWVPDTVLNDNPKPEPNGGREAHSFPLNVGLSTLLDTASDLSTKCAVCIMDA
jgi:hypothetical protein